MFACDKVASPMNPQRPSLYPYWKFISNGAKKRRRRASACSSWSYKLYLSLCVLTANNVTVIEKVCFRNYILESILTPFCPFLSPNSYILHILNKEKNFILVMYGFVRLFGWFSCSLLAYGFKLYWNPCNFVLMFLTPSVSKFFLFTMKFFVVMFCYD